MDSENKPTKDTIDDINKDFDRQKSQEEILVDQLCEGMETYDHNKNKVFVSSLTAGLEIGFSYLLIAVIYTFLNGKVSNASIPYIAAFAYPVGFIIVVLGKSMLFTEQTSLLALPVLHKKQSVKELIKLWGIVIVGNLFGGLIMALLIGFIGTEMGVITKESISSIANHVTHYSTTVIFGSAIFAGWLMALLSWLVTSSNESISRIFIIYMITSIVGFVGLHHSIVGNIEVLAALILTNDVSIITYFKFQATALLGNAFGGVFFVALLKYRTFAANF